MKATNIKQLILNFIGGGKIKFPTRFLKSVDVESPDIKSEITADDITPEFLENEDIINKIFNFGLDENSLNSLPLIELSKYYFSEGTTAFDEYTVLYTEQKVLNYSLYYNGNTLNWEENSDNKENIKNIISNSKYILIKRDNNKIVFKQTYKTRFLIRYSTFGDKVFQTITFSLYDNNLMQVISYRAGLNSV